MNQIIDPLVLFHTALITGLSAYNAVVEPLWVNLLLCGSSSFNLAIHLITLIWFRLKQTPSPSILRNFFALGNTILLTEIYFRTLRLEFSLFYCLIIGRAKVGNYTIIFQLLMGVYPVCRNMNYLAETWVVIVHLYLLYSAVIFIQKYSPLCDQSKKPATQTGSFQYIGSDAQTDYLLLDRQKYSFKQTELLGNIKEAIIIYDILRQNCQYMNNSAQQLFKCNDLTSLTQKLSQFSKVNPSNELLKSYNTFNTEALFKKSLPILSSRRASRKSIQKIEEHSSLIDIIKKVASSINRKESILYFFTNQDSFSTIFEVKLCFTENDQNFVILICRDIAYKKYIESLELINQQKSRMISFVSHEFRSPLGSIITMLEHVLLGDSANIYLKTCLENSFYLLNLCNDLLDLAQLKAQTFILNPDVFSLKDLCQECLAMFSVLAEKKHVYLDFAYEIDCPEEIVSDPNRVKQIIINLIGNAFKYTERGFIKLSISQLSKSAINVQISDSGLGIKEEDQAKLLKAFGKVNSEESRKLNASGVGLGLMISQKIASQIGDGIRFESRYLIGSSFSFTIHLQPPKRFQTLNQIEEEQDVVVQQSKSIKLEKCEDCSQILIVDDTQFNIDIFAMLLQRLYEIKSIGQWDQQNRYCRQRLGCNRVNKEQEGLQNMYEEQLQPDLYGY